MNMDIGPVKNIHRQNMLDWFTALDLKNNVQNETVIKRGIVFFSKKKYIFMIFILFLSMPFLIVPILSFINTYTFFPPLPGVEYKEWIGFLGGYLGGAITLFGVFLSLRHMKNSQVREEHIINIEKEYAILSDDIQKIDPYFCQNVYDEFSSLTYITHEQYIFQLQSIQNRINDKLSLMNTSTVFINVATEIFDTIDNCNTCKNICNIYKIKKEFINIYNNKIFMHNILTDIQKIIRNKISTISIEKIENDTKILAESSREKNFSDSLRNIERLKNAIEDVEDIKINMWQNLASLVDTYTNEYIPKMITLLKHYKYERIKYITKNCT